MHIKEMAGKKFVEVSQNIAANANQIKLTRMSVIIITERHATWPGKLRKQVMSADSRFPHVRFHDMRHAHISQRAGHANPAITLSIYAHAIPKADDKYVKAFGAQFEAAIERDENGSQSNL